MTTILYRFHQMGYGHFDIKEDNFFFKDPYSLVLGDFGFVEKFTHKWLPFRGLNEYIPVESIE